MSIAIVTGSFGLVGAGHLSIAGGKGIENHRHR